MRSPTLMLLAAASLFAVPIYHLPGALAQPGDLQPPTKPDPLPASARPAIERCEKSMADAKKVYEGACTKARNQAIKDLEPAMKTETQKGNLDGAMTIKTKVEEYKKDSAKPEPEVKASVIGRWNWGNGKTAIFRTDGTANQILTLDSSKFANGNWKEIKGTVEVQWREITTGNIFTDIITLDGDIGRVVNRGRPDIRYEIQRLPDIEKPPNPEPAAFEIPKPYLDLAERIEGGTMTATEWRDLQGTKFKVESATTSNLTKIVLKKGDIFLIAPCPTDKWQGSGVAVPVNYLGENASGIGMRLQVKVGDMEMKAFIAVGEGALSMRGNDTLTADNVGNITVKIIRLR